MELHSTVCIHNTHTYTFAHALGATSNTHWNRIRIQMKLHLITKYEITNRHKNAFISMECHAHWHKGSKKKTAAAAAAAAAQYY